MMRLPVRIALVAAVLALTAQSALPAPKDAIGLRASVDRKNVYIGDRIRYAVVARAPKGVDVQFPSFDDYKIGDFEIKDSGSRVRNRLFGGKVFERWYYIAVYSVGKQTIPQIDVKYKKKAQKDWSVQKTPAIEMSIGSVLPVGKKALDIKDIKGPISYRNAYFGIAALAITLFLFLAITIIFYRRMKRYVPVKLAHETALEELEAIRASYLQGGDIKEYYVGVSDCVRRYIERAFKVKAPEMTTEEFLGSLKDSPALSDGQKDLLKGFLSACDMVKFAKYMPSRAEAEAVYATAKSFIEEASRAFSGPAQPSSQTTGVGAPSAQERAGGKT